MQKDLSLTTSILSQCIQSCDEFQENLHSKSESAKLKRLLSICSDCSEFCSATIDFIHRESFMTKKMLRFCSEICHKFADELLKVPELDEGNKFYKVCRNAAEQCALVY